MSELFDGLGTGHFLKAVQAALKILENIYASDSDPEVASFVDQLSDLVHIVHSFHDLATKGRRQLPVRIEFRWENTLNHLESVLDGTRAIISECTPVIRPLQSSLEALRIERQSLGYIDANTRLKNQSWYQDIYDALKIFTELLRVLFAGVDLLRYQDAANEDGQVLETRSLTAKQLSLQISKVEQKLNLYQQHNTGAVRKALRAAKAVTTYVPPVPNRHFVVPRRVRAYYTGREAEIAKLKSSFQDPLLPTQQVFVICGLSGSGKTELALRFAEGYQHRFWGIFYVDGTSEKHAATSYATIAMLGGVAPNEKAAKNWLATRTLPWLLIVDNVDEDRIDVDSLLPQGARGCCIITTRNPAYTVHGNAGDRHLELLPMNPEEAEMLILKAAGEPHPWSDSVIKSAKAICHELGYLPLALEQAAKAIQSGVCEWANYLIFLDCQIGHIRHYLHRRNREKVRKEYETKEDVYNINVFSTFEILYESLQSSQRLRFNDAIELLHIFSCFHFQDLTINILADVVRNALIEEKQEIHDEREKNMLLAKLQNPAKPPWKMVFRELRAALAKNLATPFPFPRVLRDHAGLFRPEEEIQVRLREALSVLRERSLVRLQDQSTGRFSMHQLVHKWVRDRPQTSTSQQALWCQISMTTLAFSIRRPPYGNTEEEIHARRRLLPHIRHIRSHQLDLEHRLQKNSERRRWAWVLEKSYGRLETEQDIRFSRVYSETGNFKEAFDLQERALSFVSRRLGPDHPLAIRLSLLVTQSLTDMSEMVKATQFQRRVHDICIETWGYDHPLSLDITDMLASLVYYKGRLTEADSLLTRNTENLKRLYGDKHEKTLKSIRSIAKLHYRWWKFEKATELYHISWQGMKEVKGETHIETLFSLEDLAMSYIRFGDHAEDSRRDEHVALSHEYMEFVYEARRKQLGAENPWTLLADLYLARTKSEMGMIGEAEEMIRKGFEIAERNLPKEHIAFILAKTIFAEVLTKRKKYAEAESLFNVLVEKDHYSRLIDEEGDHPDRIFNLWRLSRCLEEQGKYEEALRRCEECQAGLATIGGKGAGTNHPIAKEMQRKIPQLRNHVQAVHS
ncbi:hypothetical protein BS50DRAFT_622987 [Corynespora cassiicola Philippines]|uniref:AAA+ ATPase domain-containing protein n=1 Tax=Corynespora cassiicola Philippines TaxID=1448308 RepID=A0A2T2NH98_CORCC|nr:hypothetical protein BS50DRAFT_622987 [Corynespora cassiicola Philippines]